MKNIIALITFWIMIVVYHAKLEEDFSKVIDSHIGTLPNEMMRKSRTFLHQRDSTGYLLGKILLLKSLDHWGLEKSLNNIEYTFYKKPVFTGEFSFNISHSGNWVACVSSYGSRVGIDLEELSEIDVNEFKGIFSEHEWATIQTSSNPVLRFFEIWTIKEAVAKADGRGFYLDFKAIKVGSRIKIENAEIWNIKQVSLAPEVVCHVAFSEPNSDFNLIRFYGEK